MAAFNVGHIFATVVVVANMNPKLALVLLLLRASAFVETQAYEATIGQL